MPAEQEHFGLVEHLDHELAGRLVEERNHPATPGEPSAAILVRASGALHDSVHRDEHGHGQLHRAPLPIREWSYGFRPSGHLKLIGIVLAAECHGNQRPFTFRRPPWIGSEMKGPLTEQTERRRYGTTFWLSLKMFSGSYVRFSATSLS